MTRRLVFVAVFACLAGASVIWWWHSRRIPNVIIITVDTLRPDRLSAYGYTKHHTPNFDRLAQEGVLFENAFCDVTWTTPSMASVMTGRYATAHGLRTSYQKLSPDVTTLAEILRARGYRTAAILGSFPLAAVFGLDQGFELYDDTFSLPLVILGSDGTTGGSAPSTPTPGKAGERQQMRQLLFDKASHDAYRPDNEVSDRVIRWLRKERQSPFFLWVHYFGPHEKPQPASNDAELIQLQLAHYDPDVVFADEQVGRVLAALDEMGLTRHTVVILHADHGQSLMEHDYFGHGRLLYDPSQHIPLLMRWPGVIPKAKRVTRMVRNIDILPTVLDLTRIAASMPLDGTSLLPIMAGQDLRLPEEVYAETYQPTFYLFSDLVGEHKDIRMGFRRLGIRTPQWKFIINDPQEFSDIDNPSPVTDAIRKRYYYEQLFDLRADPAEQHDVINEHPDLEKRFWNHVMEFQRMQGPKRERMPLAERDRERLRSLGYLVE